MKRVRTLCPAKLNLFLEVLGRRPDGYHELSTVMAPIDLYDTLEVTEAKRFALEVDGPPLPGINTFEKAYRAVAARRRIPGVRARLKKGIPAGSGMGGGSSDGAAMIEALDSLFDLGLDRHEVASEIGSDVNFFLERGPALCTGRGEKVAPLASRTASTSSSSGRGFSQHRPGKEPLVADSSPARCYRFLKQVRPG
jgi:4-diphosphocytidyl-2-C-methyl-D-erythritol kinase